MIKNHQNNAYSLVDEHTTTYENPFKFSAKELDDITGLYDHGARSRNPMSTLWYGIDPLFEKYPDFSPYNYCAGNPVKLVDPDGRAVYGRKNEDGTMSYIIGENENITAEGYEWIDDSYDCMDENGNYKTLPSANSTTTMSSTSQSQPTSQKNQNCSHTKTEESIIEKVWNSTPARIVVPDFITVSVSCELFLGVGGGYALNLTWVTRGKEKSFYPMFTATGKYGVGLDNGASVGISRGYYTGDPLDIKRAMVPTSINPKYYPTYFFQGGISQLGDISFGASYTQVNENGNGIFTIDTSYGFGYSPFAISTAFGISDTYLLKDFK